MRRICARYQKITLDRWIETKLSIEGMRQVFCASCKKPTAFKETLSLKHGCALDSISLP